MPFPVDSAVSLTSGGFPKLISGFGSDLVSNGYKLVRIAYFNGGGSWGWTHFRVHVYDLGVRRWRSLGVATVSHNFCTIRWRGVHLNGVIHWVCNVQVSTNTIMAGFLTPF